MLATNSGELQTKIKLGESHKMTGRRAIVGLCMLCALMISAVAAQGANAAVGTTAFTCKQVSPVGGTVGFSDAHCKNAVSTNANYEHFGFAPETTTILTGSNITTGSTRSVAKLHSVQAGIEEEIVAGIVKPGTATTPWVKNRTTGLEHYVEGEGRLLYEEIEVAKPAGKGCKVKGGKVETKQLIATSMSTEGDPKLGEEMLIKFEPTPAEKGVFAEFEIEGCSIAALNGAYTVSGSLKATPEGATLSTTAAGVTAQGTLKVRGQKAGIAGSITIEGEDTGDPGDSFTPLTTTTITTP